MVSNNALGIIFVVAGCPLIGGIPLTVWITRCFAHKNLAELGTRNMGVSAAFYHGGTGVGLLAVLAEAAKGVGAVWGARQWLPPDPTWELVALVALVVGRFWIGKGAGTTNVVWGIVTYHWQIAALLFAVSGVSTSFVRDRKMRRWTVLMLLPMLIALQRQDLSETGVAIILSSLMAWIYTQLPDDLDLSADRANADTQGVFQVLQGQKNTMLSLAQPLLAEKVGQKAANLSQLKRWGYAVPIGWVLEPGEDAEPLIQSLKPTSEKPLVVRSSAIGEDSEQASAAGQYQTFLQITSQIGLRQAIAQCQDCYDNSSAAQYRRDRGVPQGGMAVIVQVQIQGQFSGVAFSRDPTSGESETVAIEGLPGPATNVVSGKVTPERYLVRVPPEGQSQTTELTIQGETGQIPPGLIQQVAVVVREIEAHYHGVPQDMEWTYDGQTLWILQTRPITTLLPIWTRRIAAEVIPGAIRPLTWSINNPLTSGVWAELFRQILGQRSEPFTIHDLATLHYGHAYFNATLLGQLFRQMGLPAESLEFLLRGASMGRPSVVGILKTLPGLLRLAGQEWTLAAKFRREHQTSFAPLLKSLVETPATQLTLEDALGRIDRLLSILRRVTFFSILAPISAALRQKLWRVEDTDLDTTVLPETAALRSLHELTTHHPETITQLTLQTDRLGWQDFNPAFALELEDFLAQYGYLSEVETDISIPTWREDPQPVWALLQTFSNPNAEAAPQKTQPKRQNWTARIVQKRLRLKGQVAQVYSQLLAELRYTFLAVEQQAIAQGILQQTGDIFFLKLSEIREWIAQPAPTLKTKLSNQVATRKHEFELSQTLPGVPTVVYGSPPPLSIVKDTFSGSARAYNGIGASPGVIEGTVRVMRSLRQIPSDLSRQTILVVPYTDAGWSPILAQVGGIVAEVGGRLSHGAIVAREYGIPAVMDIAQATQRLKDGQRVTVDGYRGIVEIL
jgi:phosphohistidine swiveling domain-containing protein/glycerol-3-phosphate acyltransferase PlsY